MTPNTSIIPPKAHQVNHTTDIHNTVLVDPYFWLRERENPDVLTHLHAENEYTKSVMAHTEQLQEELYKEMRARIKEKDKTFPDKMGDYYYYSRTEEGQQYSIYCRTYQSPDAHEEVILDVNTLASQHDYFALGTLKLSPCQKYLAYSYDTDGSEYFRVSVKNLETGEMLENSISNTHGTTEWLSDSSGFLYTQLDSRFRPHKVFLHNLTESEEKDIVVFHEPDDAFWVDVAKSKDDKHILVQCGSSTTSEVWYASANAPFGELRCIEPRKHEHEYYVEMIGNSIYILTNNDAKNFRLVKTDTDNTGISSWQEVLAHNTEKRLQWIELFNSHIVLCYRKNGLQQLFITDYTFSNGYEVQMPEQTYSLSVARNFETGADFFRFNYTSPVMPQSVIDVNFNSGSLTVRKTQEVLGYNPEDFRVESRNVKAKDGTEIPLTILYKKDFIPNGNSPCLLYGYGSYGVSMPDRFSSNILSLLNRGFCYALAHIRGGGENGELWHDNAKMLCKINTFTDFISCAEYLVDNSFTTPNKLIIEGGSAGGLLMGAVTNMRPDLFKAVVAHVPFVDVVNTMLDPTLPLTVTEYEEWGNPNDKEYFDYMMSYSPYNNVEEKNYPNILAIGGLSDPRVSYWEPAKWVALLREKKTDNNIVMLKTNMDSGHFGTTGRFNYLKEIAFDYSFMLWMTETV